MTIPQFSTVDEVTNWAIEWLCQRGFTVRRPPQLPRMTPGEMRLKYAPHLSSSGFNKRLIHPLCPPFGASRGPTGRISLIVPTDDLIAFLRMPKLPGIELERFVDLEAATQPEEVTA